MSDKRRRRTLVVDETTTYVWTVRHLHGDGQPCREILTLHRDGRRTRIVFRDGEGRYSGGGAYTHSGGVGDRRHHLNLHEPAVVRAFVDEAVERGLLPLDGELDGWELFTAVALSRAAAATPAAPPDCPPGP
ncbi:hypothetical protein J2X68_000477 [Streptomyces sp. 3330]|uniref:hypothetical protein n=1 Tax=Streptomyces sp. 3330 TaxID=2817755 RepID=UPI0028579D9D|nr:hypothetical protein [Streptomyces sp. 3330]MDR6973808.1 hypothetical protein [Streptomyces sp. 3330]